MGISRLLAGDPETADADTLLAGRQPEEGPYRAGRLDDRLVCFRNRDRDALVQIITNGSIQLRPCRDRLSIYHEGPAPSPTEQQTFINQQGDGLSHGAAAGPKFTAEL